MYFSIMTIKESSRHIITLAVTSLVYLSESTVLRLVKHLQNRAVHSMQLPELVISTPVRMLIQRSSVYKHNNDNTAGPYTIS
jgi:hypothetical protein